jgi:CDP-glucose 4,6-dehydratase
MSLWLSKLGANVVGFSLTPDEGISLYKKLNLGADVTSVYGDICNFEVLRNALVDTQPDIVIHMAAQSLVRESYADPLGTYETNVLGTMNLLQAVRTSPNTRAVLIITSDKCYENMEWEWGYRETDRLGGYDPYSSSKACVEILTQSFRSSFFNPKNYSDHGVSIATARAGNVIGGGDWAADRLVPDILSALESDRVVQIRNPSAVRPWQHVLEPIHAYLTLVERQFNDKKGMYSGSWNFGPTDDDAKPVNWIIDELIKLWGDGSWECPDNNEPHEAGYLKLDCSKAKAQLNLSPSWSLSEALCRIVDWHKAYLSGANVKEISLAQIADFKRVTL